MNARCFRSYIYRMLTPDSIVPDPSNPQSYNRFSYSYNNPINFSDPSGHEPLCNSDGSICSVGEDDFMPTPIVLFGGETGWSNAEKAAVRAGAWKVAQALYEAGNGQFSSPGDAFLSVYGGSVTFYKTGTSSSQGAMGEAVGSNTIHVYNHSTAITAPTAGGMWAAHELGHAFNAATRQSGEFWGQGYIDLAQQGVWVGEARIAGNLIPESYSNNDNYIRTSYGYRDGLITENGGPYQQNNSPFVEEDFADMFSNWAYNSFASGNEGDARYGFMDNHMANWISLAVSNNQ